MYRLHQPGLAHTNGAMLQAGLPRAVVSDQACVTYFYVGVALSVRAAHLLEELDLLTSKTSLVLLSVLLSLAVRLFV